MKLKSLEITKANYDVNGKYHSEPILSGQATFSLFGGVANELKIDLSHEVIEDIVRVISGMVLVVCEVIGATPYTSIKNAASDNILAHES